MITNQPNGFIVSLQNREITSIWRSPGEERVKTMDIHDSNIAKGDYSSFRVVHYLTLLHSERPKLYIQFWPF